MEDRGSAGGAAGSGGLVARNRGACENRETIDLDAGAVIRGSHAAGSCRADGTAGMPFKLVWSTRRKFDES